jgi:hypothetical protein
MIFRIFAFVLFIAGASIFAAGVAKADSVAWVDPDDNTAIMQEFIDTVTYVEQKYGTGPMVVETEWMDDPNVFAYATTNGIAINKVYSTSTPERLRHEISDELAAGFFNPGCTPVTRIALHEAAHVIDGRTGRLARYQLNLAARGADLRGVLAGYSFDASGALIPGEALAEAFQAVECGTANAVEHELYSMLVQ